jgi:hypothetical protein
MPQFDFYLSAFTSAARSVTWIMGAEYRKNVPEWAAWFAQRKPASDELLTKMNAARVRSTKSEPLRTRSKVRVAIPKENRTPEVDALLATDQTVRLIPIDDESAHVVAGDRIVVVGRMFDLQHELPEFAGRNVIDVCREYFAELESLVTECEARYGRRADS